MGIKWRVIAEIENVQTGKVVDMLYLKEGFSFEAIHSTMAAMSNLDPDWVKIKAVRIERIED